MAETLQRTRPVVRTRDAAGRRDGPAAGALSGPSNGEWASSLGHVDLACLLQVIETQVLPRLLREFRPADQAPLGSGRR